MDGDKLNEAMLRAWCQYRGMEYVPDFVNPLPSENFESGFKQGVEWLMKQPLVDRLTEEEKEKIMFAYKVSTRFFKMTENTNPHVAEVFRGQRQLLISIFGKELFNEK